MGVFKKRCQGQLHLVISPPPVHGFHHTWSPWLQRECGRNVRQDGSLAMQLRGGGGGGGALSSAYFHDLLAPHRLAPRSDLLRLLQRAGLQGSSRRRLREDVDVVQLDGREAEHARHSGNDQLLPADCVVRRGSSVLFSVAPAAAGAAGGRLQQSTQSQRGERAAGGGQMRVVSAEGQNASAARERVPPSPGGL